MALSSDDPTAALQIPRRRRRQPSYRTSVVTTSNEQQLQLDWTEAKVDEPEAAEVVHEPTSEELPAVVPAAAPTPLDVTKRAYPLAYDPEGPAGPALELLNQVNELASSITQAYSEGDMATIGSRLAMIAALLANAYPYTAFNPALGAAVSFLRRATLLADVSQCGFEELMALAKAGRVLAENPLISLDESTDLVMELEGQGWVGADPDVVQFVAALFGEYPETAAIQPPVQAQTEGKVTE
jgi:hypothetical protein